MTKREHKTSSYRTTQLLHFLLWMLLVVSALRQVFVPALESASPHFGISSNGATIVDFPAMFNFAEKFWLQRGAEGSSAYSVANHLRVTSEWLGQPASYALSFGYSPTMLLLLAPLVPFSPVIAYLIVDTLGLLSVWWLTRPACGRFGLGILAFMSPLALNCLANGQTALLTGAGLLYLSQHREEDNAIVSALVLWALTAKPPLAMTAGAALLCLRRWQPVLAASALTAATTATLTPKLGWNWIGDYVGMLTTHNRIQGDPAFAWAYFPETMANLRGVLSFDCGIPDDIAARAAAAIWLTTLCCVVAFGSSNRLSSGGVWGSVLLLYLLFCPHVSCMEVLQVVLLLPFWVPPGKVELRARESILLLVPLLPFMSPVHLHNRIALFTALLFLLLSVVALCREPAKRLAEVT